MMQSLFHVCNKQLVLQAQPQLVTLYLFIFCTGFSGFQYTGVAAGLHTVTVRATSNQTGQVATTNAGTVNVDELAIQFTGISGITKRHFTYNNLTTYNYL